MNPLRSACQDFDEGDYYIFMSQNLKYLSFSKNKNKKVISRLI